MFNSKLTNASFNDEKMIFNQIISLSNLKLVFVREKTPELIISSPQKMN